MKPTLQPGLTVTTRYDIDKERTIDFMGDELRVYATPWMTRDIEETCRQLAQPHLDDGEDSVGVRVEVDHLGATLLGMWVDVAITVTEVDGPRISFEAEVRDALDTVGKAKHTRFVIDTERQKSRLQKKAAAAKEQG